MTRLIKDFEWGTLEGGFAVVDGVFREIHPWRTRSAAAFASSHGAIVTSDQRLPYDEPMKFLAPVEDGDRRVAGLMPEDMTLASAPQFAMAELELGRHSPFESQTGLFRAFASLRSEADVVAFANRFGPLGADLSTAIVDVVPEEPLKTGLELYWAEPIDQWLAEAMDMTRVVSLWDLIQAGDRIVFRPKLTRSSARLKIKTGTPEWKYLDKDWVLAKKSDNPEEFRKIAETDQQNWPQLLLGQWVNRGADGRIDLGLSGAGLNSTLTPRGLIGALWQQAALAISGVVDFLKCLECSDWFGISAEEARPEKLYCSNACRMRAYRKRKKAGKVKASMVK